MAEIDLLDVRCGSITAPAGCGKTQLIADSLGRHSGRKPILILTHTNAGVAALRSRLERVGVKPSSYRLATLDGWALRMLKTFPARSEIDVDHLELANPRHDYPAIKRAAASLLAGTHIDDILNASYSRVIVDEYQDCGPEQHQMVCHLSTVLPTVVLGDPMQEIFSWQGAHPEWEDDICAIFKPAGELVTPWRWIRAGTEGFGRWLLAARQALMAGDQIDLRDAPLEVEWVHLDGADDDAKQRQACLAKSPQPRGDVLIMAAGVQRDRQREIARQTPGAVTVENVDLTDVIDFAGGIDLDQPGDLKTALEFASAVTTNVEGSEMLRRIDVLERGGGRKEATAAEVAAMDYKKSGSAEDLIKLLVALENKPGARTFRPEILRTCVQALRSCAPGVQDSFLDAALRIREQSRMTGRRVPPRAVGSPLLLKGLEADVAVILNAAEFDRMRSRNTKNLYVAITRGSRKLIVCSASPLIG
ncbi:UvrD-helicase domain-containing protein [Rhizobium leguminosarum]|uniref:DNA 3'-5' helicase II n=1 Tax=Rhizobium leguminosarum TaxID=384 RepID=A0AAJ1A622_RHILE|nr:UvrD-helicase domain-containing protein [Rhizobium leguminosarum]MBY5532848.1 UvrD-helicase domain-containing protein [Rhizobium leguminosarum]MBY5594274.1 UvrD-helicase domain-containing protein [Rhizobium leguminosarum]MBY5627951.1 UvrD-helicase domain-containing protein [Rhizobium leguminosarum]